MPVGFKLPPNTPCRAINLVKPHIIDARFDPWAVAEEVAQLKEVAKLVGDATGLIALATKEAFEEFKGKHAQRYGEGPNGRPAMCEATIEESTGELEKFKRALELIWQRDRGWFSAWGYGDGNAAGCDGMATMVEIADAYFADNGIAERVRLRASGIESAQAKVDSKTQDTAVETPAAGVRYAETDELMDAMDAIRRATTVASELSDAEVLAERFYIPQEHLDTINEMALWAKRVYSLANYLAGAKAIILR